MRRARKIKISIMYFIELLNGVNSARKSIDYRIDSITRNGINVKDKSVTA